MITLIAGVLHGDDGRKPAPVGEIPVQEFMEPIGLTQTALAEAMGVRRKHVNELCNDRRAVTAPTARILVQSFRGEEQMRLAADCYHRALSRCADT